MNFHMMPLFFFFVALILLYVQGTAAQITKLTVGVKEFLPVRAAPFCCPF